MDLKFLSCCFKGQIQEVKTAQGITVTLEYSAENYKAASYPGVLCASAQTQPSSSSKKNHHPNLFMIIASLCSLWRITQITARV